MSQPAATPRRAHLTNKLVRALPPARSGQYVVRDDGKGAVAGLFVVVGTRTKTFTVQCDVRSLGERKTIRKAIGRAEDWDVDEARKEAKATLGSLQTGAHRAVPKRGALTLGTAWNRYQAHLDRRVAAGERSQRTVDGYRDSIERLLKGWLDTPLRDLSEGALLVAKRHEELTREHGAYAANHAMRALRAVYNHAKKRQLDRGLPSENPTAAVEYNTEKRRDTGMARDELAGWHRQLRKLANPIRQEFQLFQLLSGSRPGALARAQWKHLDVGRRVLHFPDPKGGPRKAFDMPLSRAMLRCLWRARHWGRRLYPVHARTYIFAADTATGCIHEKKEKRSRLSKFNGDLRQTYRTAAQAVGLPDMDIHLLMNHSLGGVNAGYITRGALLDHLLGQQERISRYLVEAMSQKAT